MKKYLILLFIIFQCKKFDSQFVSDDFTSIGGAGQWCKQSGGSTMGVDGGTYLCYNIASSYSNNTINSFESPNYSSNIVSANCNTINISFRAVGNIRGSDTFVFCSYNGSWTCYNVSLSGVLTTYGITVPNTHYRFSFDLYTGNSGNVNGRYIHIDWFRLECASLLGVNIIDFKGSVGNYIDWVIQEDAFGSQMSLERSLDGYNWSSIHKEDDSYYGSFLDDDYKLDTVNYYRLKVVNDNDVQYSEIISINNKRKNKKVVGLYNILGEMVDINYKGLVLEVYEDGTIVKKINI